MVLINGWFIIVNIVVGNSVTPPYSTIQTLLFSSFNEKNPEKEETKVRPLSPLLHRLLCTRVIGYEYYLPYPIHPTYVNKRSCHHPRSRRILVPPPRSLVNFRNRKTGADPPSTTRRVGKPLIRSRIERGGLPLVGFG